MAPNNHDPTHQNPPVFPTDEWDHEQVLAPPQATCTLVLPTKRQPAACARATQHSPPAGHRGLRIHKKSAARHAHATIESPLFKEFGGTVVKLQPRHDEGSFQASMVIPAGELTLPEAPQKLQGEGKDWGLAYNTPKLWMWGACLTVAAMLVTALATQELYLMKRKAPRSQPIEVVREARIEEVTGFEIGGPSEEAARGMAAAYAQAKTPEDVLPLIRNAPRLAARLKLDWQPWNAPPHWQPAREAMWEVSGKGGVGHGLLRGQKPDFSSYAMYFVCEGESLRIDWEATQGLGDADFSTLVRGVGSGGVIRAFITPENFYSLTFPESEFRSFKMLAPDREHVLWGYAKSGTPAESALAKAFSAESLPESANAAQPITLRLTPGPKGAQKNQWLIGEMLHIDWVSP